MGFQGKMDTSPRVKGKPRKHKATAAERNGMTDKPKIKGKLKPSPEKSVSVLHTTLHALSYGEDLAAHLGSRHAYSDNTPKKGVGKAHKRSKKQNEAYANQQIDFRERALSECNLPLDRPDMFNRLVLHVQQLNYNF